MPWRDKSSISGIGTAQAGAEQASPQRPASAPQPNVERPPLWRRLALSQCPTGSLVFPLPKFINKGRAAVMCVMWTHQELAGVLETLDPLAPAPRD